MSNSTHMGAHEINICQGEVAMPDMRLEEGSKGQHEPTILTSAA